MSNSSNQFIIPKEYRQYVDELALDFSALDHFNSTNDLLSMNATDLKEIWQAFVGYHNAVGERALAGGDQGGNETLRPEL
jgi:hypothetical protein